MMKRILSPPAFVALVVLVVLGLMPLAAAESNSVRRSYVEARTAEVFTGGCVMASEAETTGREAVLAWKVDRGSFNGVALDDLSVVAAVAGDKNLGIYELGGEKAVSRSALVVDERANPAQRLALVAMASDLAKGVLGRIVNVSAAPIQFADKRDMISVSTVQVALDVNKHLTHDPSCGAQQWFHPLSSVENPAIGVAEQHSFTGSALGAKWSDPNKPSAFFGTFGY
jgi:hypothetical protein